jgi:thiol-disulfide isomerase/thioredoxin
MSKPPETLPARRLGQTVWVWLGLGLETDAETGEQFRRRNFSLWVWLALLLASAATLAYLASTPRLPPDNFGANFPGVGVELSTIRFEPLTGDPPPITKEDLRGKVALINYWGPWCFGCRVEMPHLLKLEEKLGGREDFRLVLVSNDATQDDLETLRHDSAQFLKGIGTDHPSWHDPQAHTIAALAREAKLPSTDLPLTFVLDREGVLRGVWIGYRPGDEENVEELVRELLD